MYGLNDRVELLVLNAVCLRSSYITVSDQRVPSLLGPNLNFS